MILYELRIISSFVGIFYFFQYVGLIDSLLKIWSIMILKWIACLNADISDMTVSFYDGIIIARKVKIFAPSDSKWKIDTIINVDTIICHLDIISAIYWLIQSNYYVVSIKYVFVCGLKISVEAWENPQTGEQILNTSFIGLIPTKQNEDDEQPQIIDTAIQSNSLDKISSPTAASSSKSPTNKEDPIKQPQQQQKLTEGSFSLSSYFSTKTTSIFTDVSEMWQDVNRKSISEQLTKFSETLSSTASEIVTIAQSGNFFTVAQDKIHEAYTTVKQSFGLSLRSKLEQLYESVSGVEPAPEADDARIYGRYIDLFDVEVQLRNALPVALRELEVKKGLRAPYFRIYLHELHHRVIPKAASAEPHTSLVRRTSSAEAFRGFGSREDLTWVEVESASDSVKDIHALGSESKQCHDLFVTEDENTWRVVASPLLVHPTEPVTSPSLTINSSSPLPLSPPQSQEVNTTTPCFQDWKKLMKSDSFEYDLNPDAWNGIHSKILSYRFEKALLMEVLKGNAGKYYNQYQNY